MDEIRARRMLTELGRRPVGGWVLGEFLGFGKSAFVVRATKDGQPAAIKVFDPELVQRDHDEQIERIDRQVAAGKYPHPNLVRVFAGGACPETGLLYVVMELLEGTPLSQHVATLSPQHVPRLLSQIAAAARHLEDLRTVHRDIKPDNVHIVGDPPRAILLDLGVIRPIDPGGITDDGDSRPFLATHQYASPEYLFRRESDDPSGWRALTFYQLGGVLHDMIMRRPLFADQSRPNARLVEAVRSSIPVVHSDEFPPDLVRLAQHCLLKDPRLRLRLVTWDHFSEDSRSLLDPLVEARNRLRAFSAAASTTESDQAGTISTATMKRARDVVENVVRNVSAEERFTPIEVGQRRVESPAAGFTARLKPTSTIPLICPLVLKFVVRALAGSPLVVDVSLGVWLAPSEGAPATSEVTSVYCGLLDEAALEVALRTAIVVAVASAAEVRERPGSAQSVPVVGADASQGDKG